MKEKKGLPIWSIVLAVAAVLAIVGVIFIKGGDGSPSKQDLAEMRREQQH